MKLKPLGDRLIVQAVEEEETTASGIVLPDTAKEKPQKGKVLAVGDGAIQEDGSRRPLDVGEGDEVLYSKYGGTEITVDGDELLVLREADVLEGRLARGLRKKEEAHIWLIRSFCTTRTREALSRTGSTPWPMRSR